jgi:hypothetical protein
MCNAVLRPGSSRASDRGRIGVFYASKINRIGDDVGDFKYVFTKKIGGGGENDPPDTVYPPYYARI